MIGLRSLRNGNVLKVHSADLVADIFNLMFADEGRAQSGQATFPMTDELWSWEANTSHITASCIYHCNSPDCRASPVLLSKRKQSKYYKEEQANQVIKCKVANC